MICVRFEVETLRQVWVQHFHLAEGEVARRDPKDRPPGATRLVTPYDVEARGGKKSDTVWDGYKVHLTETCEPQAVHLITNVVTTPATTSDDRMAAIVHAGLAARNLLPDEHWVDTGYAKRTRAGRRTTRSRRRLARTAQVRDHRPVQRRGRLRPGGLHDRLETAVPARTALPAPGGPPRLLSPGCPSSASRFPRPAAVRART